MTAVAVATPSATDPETRHEYFMLARIKRDIVKGAIFLGPCKSAITVSLNQLRRVVISLPISPVMKAASTFSPR